MIREDIFASILANTSEKTYVTTYLEKWQHEALKILAYNARDSIANQIREALRKHIEDRAQVVNDPDLNKLLKVVNGGKPGKEKVLGK